jgi:putative thymidine phosphorylase
LKFKVKTVSISTGTVPVVVLDRQGCEEMDLHLNERVRVVNPRNRREIIAAVDFYETGSFSKNTIVLLSEVYTELKIKNNDYVEIHREENPASVRYIKDKLHDEKLSKEQIETIIKDVVKGRLTDIDLTYFVSGCYINGLTFNEVIYLTQAIVDSGERLNLRSTPHEKIFDKHCVGGVAGNRTTMLVIPIVAAYGLRIPKTSSRAITSPAGTADTMEVLANVSLDADALSDVVHKTNACIVWGGGLNLAPADDKIIRVEHPLSIDTDGLMLSSILAKKISVGSTHVLIDIPYGEYAKVKTRSRAKKLRNMFIKMGKKLGIQVKVIITDGTQPIGNGVGPLLEAIDVLKVLRNDPTAPRDLREKTLFMASELLNMQIKNIHKSRYIVRELLDSGKAYHKFMEIIDAQGRKKLPELAKFRHTISSDKQGIITFINNSDISRMARYCGAPKTKEAGLYLHRKVNEVVRVGDPIITLYANNEQSLNYAREYYYKNRPYKIK